MERRNALQRKISESNQVVKLLRTNRLELESSQALRDEIAADWAVRSQKMDKDAAKPEVSSGYISVRSSHYATEDIGHSIAVAYLSVKDITRVLRMAAKHGWRQRKDAKPYFNEAGDYREYDLWLFPSSMKVKFNITFNLLESDVATCEMVKVGYEKPLPKFKMMCGEELKRHRELTALQATKPS